MKRHLLLITIVLALLRSTSSYAIYDGTLGADNGANPNPHNLSSASTSGAKIALTETQICIFCHTPHGATLETPLWGRLAPDGPPGGFLTYAAAIKDAGGNLGIDDPAVPGGVDYGTGEYPNGASKLCLSCHDGVTAMGILANGIEIDMSTAGTNTTTIDLAVSHPISFIYTPAVEDYLNTPAANKTDEFTYYDLIGNPGPRKIILDKLDPNSRIQCTVCHEPHKDTKIGVYTLPFWRLKGAGVDAAADYNATCTECHGTVLSTYPQTLPETLHNLNLP